jgi:Zn finger protein HypA/HybF involved in hydrogenase expression
VTSYYDDNFGHWEDTDDEETRRFYHQVQRTNVRKKCQGCGREVSIQPHYAYCDTCATKREQGWDL